MRFRIVGPQLERSPAMDSACFKSPLTWYAAAKFAMEFPDAGRG